MAPQKPFRVYGNTWHVGPRGLGVFLITAPTGNVLIDGGVPGNAPLIEANIRSLGINLRDIKWILNSHAHCDHAGGIARLVRASSAQVIASAADTQLLARGGHDDPQYVAHAFSHGFHPQHTERLAAYWGEAWGGPTTYSQRYGSESSVVRMHSGNGPHEEMDRRAIECFDRALDDVGLAEPVLRGVLHKYFAWATKNSMAAYPESADNVPTDLRIPHWSWEGLQP